MIAVSGAFDVELVQVCVVTLEPFKAHLIDKVEGLFAPPAFFRGGAHENHVDEGDAEGPERIVNGMIDLGEFVAQHIALALDPYPRKPGATFEAGAPTTGAGGKPFANLASMLQDGKKDS
jgi:uncharacterized metal-binding protein YceD (DUF177 family)